MEKQTFEKSCGLYRATGLSFQSPDAFQWVSNELKELHSLQDNEIVKQSGI